MQIHRGGKNTSGKSVSDGKKIPKQGEKNLSMTWARELKEVSRRSGGRLKKDKKGKLRLTTVGL